MYYIYIINMKNTTHFYKTNPRTGNAQQVDVGDCVTRSIVIALNLDYNYVYSKLSEGMKKLSKTGFILRSKDRVAPSRVGKRVYPRARISARNGVYDRVYEPFLKKHGYEYLNFDFLPRVIPFNCDTLANMPKGTYILLLKKHVGGGHLTCVKDNVIYDSWDCATSEKRKYYINGIFHQEPNMKDIVKSWL
jgi:hypothetical protein